MTKSPKWPPVIWKTENPQATPVSKVSKNCADIKTFGSKIWTWRSWKRSEFETHSQVVIGKPNYMSQCMRFYTFLWDNAYFGTRSQRAMKYVFIVKDQSMTAVMTNSRCLAVPIWNEEKPKRLVTAAVSLNSAAYTDPHQAFSEDKYKCKIIQNIVFFHSCLTKYHTKNIQFEEMLVCKIGRLCPN